MSTPDRDVPSGGAGAASAVSDAAAEGPLAGVVVLDLTRALAGPHAAMMLGDLGARVIKIETPGHGDDTRGWGPPFVQPEPAAAEAANTDRTANGEAAGASADTAISTYFLSCNRNKESVTLDLKSEAGKAALTELIKRSDVLMENFRPGVLDRLGFGMERLDQLNPSLVVLSISGFGHDGPEGGRAGYDQIAQGEAGLMSMTGPDRQTPTKVGVPIADLLSGMYGAYGVLAALLERERTGRGSVVRTSLLAGIVGVHAFQGTRWTVAGEVPKAEGPHHPSICPYGLFHSADGIVQIAVGSEALWRKFAPAFDLPVDAPGYASNAERVGNATEVRAAVERAFSEYPTAALLAKLTDIGIPSGEVKNLQQVYEWEQTRSQGLLIDVEHPTLGTIALPGPPLRLFHGDTEWRREHTAPPLLGQHTEQVLDWLGQSGGGN
ncbi:CaiB/BaiF CoA transferase family protein [Nakamurella aerolata]|uniref:CoA transferase n=1 Tax=Nakamurella aerolata TaxID=1656892 RepID=A0A849A8B6_9ACTN|nr:CoA transferase [Nakamurella aerolata]NNG36745.1 CoA transferase [Nakamurella aerolata]